MKRPFKASSKPIEPGKLRVTLEGRITEEALLPALDLTTYHEIEIDLGNVDYINSAGVKSWMLWNREREKKFPKVKMSFFRISAVIARQLTTIATFIPVQSQILSISIPCYCDACNRTTTTMVETQAYAGMLAGPIEEALSKLKCPDCGGATEIDGDPQAYSKCIVSHSSASKRDTP